MPATRGENMELLNECDNEEEPKDIKDAHVIIKALRMKCRSQTEQIMSWKKAYSQQQELHHRHQKEKAEQLNYLTSQLLLLESRIMKKQKQVSNVMYQKELTIYRQQKIIETLSSRLIDHGIIDIIMDPSISNNNDFDSLNDSDSAVVLEDIDSDCNSSIIFGGSTGKSRCNSNKMNNDVTIVRSISDAIETNLKYSNTRRSNCFLRRPEVLETVYSVEEDPEPSNNNNDNKDAVTEKRDKFRQRTDKCISSDTTDDHNREGVSTNTSQMTVIITASSCDIENSCDQPQSTNKHAQVTNYNRVMSNHRSVTKPKDVKYKRINKAKSKSLEELRGRLRHWVERGTCNINMNIETRNPIDPSIQQAQQNMAQSYA